MTMLLEKLFLDVLIVLSPVLFIIAFDDRGRLFNSPYKIGVYQGIASALCLIFSYQSLDLYWDLRYAPLVISTIYGGPVAGLINYIFIIIFRTFVGGPGLLLGYLSVTVTLLGVLLFVRKAKQLRAHRRTYAVILMSFIPSTVMFLIAFSITLLEQVNEFSDFEPVIEVLIIGLLQTLGVWITSVLLELYVERNKMKEEIQRTLKLKTSGEVAASMAHEIRNPLTVVQGFLQLMKNTITDAKNLSYLVIALDELKRAERVIHDYLNFSKPKLAISEKISLSALIETIVVLLTPLSSYKNVAFNSQVEEDIFIYTDRSQLQQALVNVVKNAVEASPENTVVQIRLSKLDHEALIEIIDQGRGMTPEEIGRIGTLFYTTKESGTGLGTSVAVKVIEIMKGKITYSSRIGEGTVCTITLPLGSVHHG